MIGDDDVDAEDEECTGGLGRSRRANAGDDVGRSEDELEVAWSGIFGIGGTSLS